MDKTLAILHLEDNQLDADLVRAILKSAKIQAQVTLVETEAGFDAALRRGGFDIILGDYNLPGYDGLKALHLAQKVRPEIPFVFVTGTMEEDVAIRALTQGATDYVFKHRLDRLGQAVRRALQESEDKALRRQAEQALLKSEAQYRLLTENMQDVIWIADVEAMRTTYISPSVQRLRGYTPEEVYKLPFSETLPAQAYERILDLMSTRGKAFLSGAEPADRFYIDELPQRCKDGSLVWTEVVTRFTRNPETGRLEILGVTHDIRQRKLAEQSLRESEQRFRSVFENAGMGIVLADLSGQIVRTNPSFQQMLDYSEAELAGLTVAQITHPDDLPASHQLFLDLAAGKIDTNQLTKRYLRSDGRVIWALVTVSMIEEGEDQPALVLGVSQEITRRVQAEISLQESENRLKAIFNNSPDLQFLLEIQADGSLQIAFYNQTFASLLARYQVQIPASEVVGLELMQYLRLLYNLSEPEIAGIMRLYRQVVETLQPAAYEMRRQLPGGVFYGISRVAPLLDDSGACRRLLVSVQDVTASKNLEQALRASEEKYRSLVQQASDGISITDASGTILEWNQSLAEITGLSPDQTIGQPISTILYGLIPPDQRDAEVALLLQKSVNSSAIRSPELQRTSVTVREIQRPDGQRRIIQTYYFPIRLESGYLFAASSHDITEQKHLEEQLRALNGAA